MNKKFENLTVSKKIELISIGKVCRSSEKNYKKLENKGITAGVSYYIGRNLSFNAYVGRNGVQVVCWWGSRVIKHDTMVRRLHA